MKMEITKIQMTQYMQSEDNSETKSSVSVTSANNKHTSEEKRSDGFSLQINNTDVFKKKGTDSYHQTRNSLVSAGLNVIEGMRGSSSKEQPESSGSTPASKSKNPQSEHKR